jgi:hypothetical protein
LTVAASKHTFQLLPRPSRFWWGNSRGEGTNNLQITRGDNSNMETPILVFKNGLCWIFVINYQKLYRGVWKVSGLIIKRGWSVLLWIVDWSNHLSPQFSRGSLNTKEITLTGLYIE